MTTITNETHDEYNYREVESAYNCLPALLLLVGVALAWPLWMAVA